MDGEGNVQLGTITGSVQNFGKVEECAQKLVNFLLRRPWSREQREEAFRVRINVGCYLKVALGIAEISTHGVGGILAARKTRGRPQALYAVPARIVKKTNRVVFWAGKGGLAEEVEGADASVDA